MAKQKREAGSNTGKTNHINHAMQFCMIGKNYTRMSVFKPDKRVIGQEVASRIVFPLL